MSESPAATLRHEGAVRACCFSPDGEHLATAGADRLIHVWSTSDWSALASFGGHERSVGSLRFCCGGARLLSASTDGSVRVWSFPNGEALGRREGHRSAVCAPDEELIASWRGKNQCVLWNALDDAYEQRLRAAGRISAMVFTPDGRQLIVAPSGEDIEVWDVERAVRVETIASDPEEVVDLACAPLPEKLVVAGASGRLELHALGTWEESGSIELGAGPVRAMGISSGGRLVAIGGEGRVRLFDIERLEAIEAWDLPVRGVHDVAISPNGAWIAVAAADGLVRVWPLQWRSGRAGRPDSGPAAATGGA